jgi:hypothetical protein
MNKYKILWYEDEPEINEGFSILAETKGITLQVCKTSKEAIIELKKNYKSYDGIILDIIGHNKSNKETTDTQGFYNLKTKIDEIRLKKYLPIFIFTGQEDKKENKGFDNTIGEIKKYFKATDKNKLIEDIIFECGKLEDTQLKHKYSKVFEICNEKYLNNEREILHLANILEKENNQTLNKDTFTSIRKVIEKLFIKLYDLGVIPNKIHDEGKLNPKSYFITGTHKEFTLKELFHLDNSSAFLITTLLKITQDASHSLSNEKALRIDDFITSQQTQHLLKSSIHILFDILIYFKKYIDKIENSTETTYWVKIETSENEWIYGTVKASIDGWGNFYSDCSPHERISISKERMLHLKINEKIHIQLDSNPKYVGDIKEHPKI